jgi:hypothetical protein
LEEKIFADKFIENGGEGRATSGKMPDIHSTT